MDNFITIQIRERTYSGGGNHHYDVTIYNGNSISNETHVNGGDVVSYYRYFYPTAKIELSPLEGIWKFIPYKLCVICGKPPAYDTVELGYPSKHDMEIVCENCCVKYIDPAIDNAIELEKEK